MQRAIKRPDNDDFLARNIVIDKLEKSNREIAEVCNQQTRRIHDLELELADAHGRMLDQAKYICELMRKEEDAPIRRSVREIAMEVLDNYPGVTWEDIIGVRRTKWLIQPRHACIRAVYDERKDLSLPSIGRIFRRDHTSILSAVKKFGATRRSA